MRQFSNAVDNEEISLVKQFYEELIKMVHPDSHERKLIDLDMEMIDSDDKA